MIKNEDIIKPLIFLDIFDYPPTAMELWRFLGVKAELEDIAPLLSKEGLGVVATAIPDVRALENTPRPSATPLNRGEYFGFYFLPGRQALVEKRREFFHLSERKFKIAKRAAWLLHFIPSIKMIAVCNNFYYREQSDIDFFIITTPRRLWLTRFSATLLLDLFHLRARGEKTADKICLSFYLSLDNLNLESVLLKPDDPYISYWLAFLEPIYGEDCYNKFWEANAWLKNIFPNAWPKIPVPRRCVGGGKILTTPNPSLKRRGDWLEKIAKKIQWWKIPQHVKEMAALDDNRVVINETMLKFHENDRREEFRNNYKLRIINYKL